MSKNARINEVAALRVAVVELQSRARSQLLGPISTQDVANIQEAAGATNVHAANVLPGLNLSGTRDAADIQAAFETTESRRHRLFQTYLAERRFYAASVDYVFTLMLQERLPTSASNDALSAIRTSFLQAYGIAPGQPSVSSPDARNQTYHTLAFKNLGLLPNAIQLVQAGLDGVVEDKSVLSDVLDTDYLSTLFTEMLHRMTIAFQLLDLSSDVFVSPPLAIQWFSLVTKLSFLNRLEDVCILPTCAGPNSR